MKPSDTPKASARHVRRRQRQILVQALEPRRLLAFSNADLTDTWGLAAMDAFGTVQFDGAGGISGGTITDESGSTSTPSGTYSVDSSGGVTFSPGGPDLIGALNASKDAAATTNLTDNSLNLLLNSGSGSFSNADLNGTWSFFINGDSGQPDNPPDSFNDNSGHGVVTFDGAGAFSVTIIADESSLPQTRIGTYTVSPGGAVTFTAITDDGSKTFTGSMNASKDLVGLTRADLPTAVTNNESRMIVLVRRLGNYTNANAAGTWIFVLDHAQGTFTLDGAGHISSGSVTSPDGTGTITSASTYHVNSDGTFSVHAITTDTSGTHTNDFSGALSATRDVGAFDRPDSGEDGLDDLAIMINSGAAAVPLAIGVNSPTVVEGTSDTPTTVTFVVSLSQPATSVVTVDYATQDGTAHDVTDYTGVSDTLTFAIGEINQTVSVLVAADADEESDETFRLVLSNASSGTILSGSSQGVATIVNDDGVLSDADLNDTWTLAGMESEGTVEFDGAGNITGGSLSNDTGGTDIPSGTYSVASTGVVTIDAGSNSEKTGAINASRNFVAISGTANEQNNLTLLVNSASGSFSDADLHGTWNLFVNGDKKPEGQTPSGSTGHGAITFDGAGHLTVLFIKDTNGQVQNLTGTYSVSSSGAVNITILGTEDTLMFVGAMNAAKDLVALSATDLQSAAAHDDSRLFVLVRRAGAYSNASARGTWHFFTDSSFGVMTLDGAGHVSGTTLGVHGETGTSSFSGSYVVAPAGTFSFSITIQTAGGGTETFHGLGAIDASRDVVAMGSPNSGAKGQDDLVMLVRSVEPGPIGQPPTIVSLTASVDTVTRGDALTLTANGVTDPDGTIRFVDFFVDTNGNDTLDADDRRIARDAFGANGYSANVRTLRLPTGDLTFFARAQDNSGNVTDPVSATVTILNAPPTIARLVVAPASLFRGRRVSVIAAGVRDVDGTVTTVEFWDDDGDGIFDPESDTSLGTGVRTRAGWKLTPSPNTLDLELGSHTIFAQATDNDEATSNVVMATLNVRNAVPVIAGVALLVTRDPDTGDVLRSLVARGVRDPDAPDGQATDVLVWEDLNHDGIIDEGETPSMDPDPDRAGVWTFDLSSADPGLHRYRVFATDDDGGRSRLVAISVLIPTTI